LLAPPGTVRRSECAFGEGQLGTGRNPSLEELEELKSFGLGEVQDGLVGKVPAVVGEALKSPFERKPFDL
jgi:hypothetical protein